MAILRTYSEAKSDIIRFFGNFDTSTDVSDAKTVYLSALSTQLEEAKVNKFALSGREHDLLKQRAELDTAVEMEETDRSQQLQECGLEIGKLRTVKDTVLNFQIQFNKQEKSCHISPVPVPDYTQRSDAILSVYTQQLDSFAGGEHVRVCVDEMDNLYIVSGKGKSITVLDKDLQLVRQFENELLSWPYSISIWNECIFVTEWDSSSLLKFSLDGAVLGRFGGMCYPTGLEVTPNNGLVYVVCKDTVSIFTHELVHVTSFGAFNGACDVKLARDGTLLVLDEGGKSMHWLTQDGHQGVFRTGCQYNMAFFFIDAFDNILLSDFSQNAIHVYSQDGQLTASLDNKGNKETLENRSLTIRHDGIIVCASQREPYLNFF